MKASLDSAIAVVVQDLRSSGGPDLNIVDSDWSAVEGQITVMIRNPSGTGMGLYIMRDWTFTQQVAAIAEQIQEWAVEELWSVGESATWPQCPRHPDSHPLQAAVENDTAVWKCPVLDVRIAEVGRLGGGGYLTARTARSELS
jgi:hypothetical protein